LQVAERLGFRLQGQAKGAVMRVERDLGS